MKGWLPLWVSDSEPDAMVERRVPASKAGKKASNYRGGGDKSLRNRAEEELLVIDVSDCEGEADRDGNTLRNSKGTQARQLLEKRAVRNHSTLRPARADDHDSIMDSAAHDLSDLTLTEILDRMHDVGHGKSEFKPTRVDETKRAADADGSRGLTLTEILDRMRDVQRGQSKPAHVDDLNRATHPSGLTSNEVPDRKNVVGQTRQKFKPAHFDDSNRVANGPSGLTSAAISDRQRAGQGQSKFKPAGVQDSASKRVERDIRKAVEREVKFAVPEAREHGKWASRPAADDEEVRVPTPPLPPSLIGLPPETSQRNENWISTETDYRFAQLLIANSIDPTQTLYDEIDEFSARFDVAHALIERNKNTPKESSSVNQKAVFSLAEMRQQLLKVFDAVLGLIRSTDTVTPNTLMRLHKFSNVIVIQTVKCHASRNVASSLISGKSEDLSFLSYLIRAHKFGHVEKLRTKIYHPHVHQELRETWEPEALVDIELRERILAATSATITGGPSTFIMVPLVEMHLHRTRIMTQKSVNGHFEFIVDVIPVEYSDFLEAYLGLERDTV